MSDCEIGIGLSCLEACDNQEIDIDVTLTLCEFHTKQMFHRNLTKKIEKKLDKIKGEQMKEKNNEMKILGKLLIQCPTLPLYEKIVKYIDDLSKMKETQQQAK